MRKPIIFALTLLTCSLCGGISLAQDSSQQQDSGQPPASSGNASKPGTSSSSSSNSSSKDKSKTSPPAASSSANPDQKSSPDAPQPAPAKKPSTAQDNPFPEDVSRKAAADAKADANSTAPNGPAPNSTPGAQQSQGSSSRDGLDKLGMDDDSRKKLKLESPDGSVDVYDPKRATEDVRVGKFYLQTGDFKGAYDRFKDATLFDHEDVEAVFWLAEAARKVNKPQEAIQNYLLYLDAVPDGPDAKPARKALSELSATSSRLTNQHP